MRNIFVDKKVAEGKVNWSSRYEKQGVIINFVKYCNEL
jgi:hypothetical protein